MTEYKRVILLVLVMAVVVTAVTAVAIGILYGTAFERERLHLISTAQEQTALIAAVAQFDRTYHSDFPGGPQAATIGQIVAAHEARPVPAPLGFRNARSGLWEQRAIRRSDGRAERPQHIERI